LTKKTNTKTDVRTMAATPARDAKLLTIARELLFLETLETRNMDGLDFSEQAVWSLKEALEAAFAAGRAAAETEDARAGSIETATEAMPVGAATSAVADFLVKTKAEALAWADLADVARGAYAEDVDEAKFDEVLFCLDDIRFAARRAGEEAHFGPFALRAGGPALHILRNAANSVLANLGAGGTETSADSKKSSDGLIVVATALALGHDGREGR
jgi:hypothetical protein